MTIQNTWLYVVVSARAPPPQSNPLFALVLSLLTLPMAEVALPA
jgi:hypothetical protein